MNITSKMNTPIAEGCWIVVAAILALDIIAGFYFADGYSSQYT